MGVPIPEMNAADEAPAEALLSSLRTIAAAERRKHASVFNYWLSIRQNREFPPIRDLDPLEISDAGPFSVLLEMIGAEDADIRHIGQAIKGDIDVTKLSDAPNPSVLSCIAKRIPVVAACRQAFAFEDEFKGPDGKVRCWVTLLPFSATGTWIDYVYGFVSVDPAPDAVEEATVEPVGGLDPEAAGPAGSVAELLEMATELANAAAEQAEGTPPPFEEAPDFVQDAPEPAPEAFEEDVVGQDEGDAEAAPPEPDSASSKGTKAGFSAKLREGLASVGFYGKNIQVEPDLPPIPVADEDEPMAAGVADEPQAFAEVDAQSDDDPSVEPDMPLEATEETEPATPNEAVAPEEPVASKPEGSMQSKLDEIRAKADEARQAKLRANIALYEGLSAAYDFALDAEDNADEYLKLVEAEGLKIQLRSPMKPVVKLAFNGMCDDATIAQLEAVLAWALKADLPRGSLAEQIEQAGGIGPILEGQARAA
jgi:hypothetical protein